MEKIIAGVVIMLMIACGGNKSAAGKSPLYQVLTVQNDGGANIRFYEILTEEKEIAMLRGDENLKNKVAASDMAKSNYIILNMGEKPTSGYSITIDNVVETADKVIITLKEKEPSGMAAQVISYPYSIVRINSKKPIEIK